MLFKTSSSVLLLLTLGGVDALSKKQVHLDDEQYPAFRYVPWSDLSSDFVEQAKSLGYQESTWNTPGTARVEKRAYEDLNKRETEAAVALGFTDKNVWDCYMNHYDDYDWDELDTAGVQYYFELLGWTEARWSENGDDDTTADFMWDKDWTELDAAQQTAARQLCFQQETWDGVSLDEWTCTKDHYNELSWGELEEVGVQQYLINLGFTEDSWNGDAPEPEAYTSKGWDELTEKEQTAAIHLCYFKDTWNGPAASTYPVFRFRPWSSLASNMKDAAEDLGYGKDTWNVPGTARVEDKAFEALDDDQRDSARTLGFSESSWDCWMNHYYYFDWDALDSRFDIQGLYRTIGYSRDTWEDDDESIPADEMKWQNLTDSQRTAAIQVCYLQQIWDQTNLEEWGCSQQNCFCHYNWYSWNDLEREDVQKYFATMGWTREMWDAGTRSVEPASYKQKWDRLTDTEQDAASQICYTRNSWDRFIVENAKTSKSKTTASGSVKSSKGGGTIVGLVVATLILGAVAFAAYKYDLKSVAKRWKATISAKINKSGKDKSFNQDTNLSPRKPYSDDDDVVETYSDAVDPIESAVPA